MLLLVVVVAMVAAAVVAHAVVACACACPITHPQGARSVQLPQPPRPPAS